MTTTELTTTELTTTELTTTELTTTELTTTQESSPGKAKRAALMGNLFSNQNSTGGIQISQLTPASTLTLLLNYDGDMSGCLKNCTNRGKCALNDQFELVCECNEYYVGVECEIDSRPCSSKLFCY